MNQLPNRYYRELNSKTSEGIIEPEPTGGCWGGGEMQNFNKKGSGIQKQCSKQQ